MTSQIIQRYTIFNYINQRWIYQFIDFSWFPDERDVQIDLCLNRRRLSKIVALDTRKINSLSQFPRVAEHCTQN